MSDFCSRTTRSFFRVICFWSRTRSFFLIMMYRYLTYREPVLPIRQHARVNIVGPRSGDIVIPQVPVPHAPSGTLCHILCNTDTPCSHVCFCRWDSPGIPPILLDFILGRHLLPGWLLGWPMVGTVLNSFIKMLALLQPLANSLALQHWQAALPWESPNTGTALWSTPGLY